MIGKLLRLFRVTNDITVRDMAKILAVSASTVSRIERGGNIDTQTMIKLLNWLFLGGEK